MTLHICPVTIRVKWYKIELSEEDHEQKRNISLEKRGR